MHGDTTTTSGSPATTEIRRGAKAALTTDQSVLLVKELHADGTPFWTLPGGGLMPAESPRMGLKRELREELACRVQPTERLDTIWYAHRGAHTVTRYTVFDCRVYTQLEPQAVAGVLDAQWYGPDALPTSTLPQVRACIRTVCTDSSR